MSLQRVLALLTLPVVTVFVIAGCATTAPSDKPDKNDTDSSETDEDEADEPDIPAEGELAEPGTTVGADVWLTHSFTSSDDGEALISSRLVSVEPVTDEQLAFLNQEAFTEGQLDGFDLYMILVDEKKESGDSVVYDSDYSYYRPIDKDGEKVQPVTVILWDECPTPSFDEAFDTAGAVLTQCLLAAVPEGEDAPAGVAYTGGYEDDNPYDFVDGKPLFFIID